MDRVALDEPTLDSWLNIEERARAARFAFPHIARRYRIGRVALRLVLGRWLGVDAREIAFSITARGKPYLSGGPAFNLSSSGSLLLIGVSSGAEIGVDVEVRRPLEDMPELARRYFSEREQAEMCTLPKGLRPHAFFRGWSRKEAVAKAIGEGLHLDFPSFSVPLDGFNACTPVTVSAAFPHGSGWFVRSLPWTGEGEAAIAAKAPIEIGPRYWIGPDLTWTEETQSR
jgi:4'-phosphopantetheinyl transferase